MSNRRKVASIAFTGVAAAAATTIAGPAAFASGGHWKIANSGTPFKGSYRASNVGTTVLSDNKTGAKLSCTSASVSGNVPSSSVPVATGGTDIATANTNFGKVVHCRGPNGVGSFSAAATANLYASSSANNVVHGTIRAIAGKITGLGATAGCHAKVRLRTGVTGLHATYHNASHLLSIPQTASNKSVLSIFSVGTCLGQLNNGDPATFHGKFQATSPAGLTITDP